MNALDLNNMSIDDLKQLHRDVSKAIETFEARRKSEALSVLEAKAKELGFASLAHLTDGTKTRKSSGGVPKYANPSDPSQTWTGKGRAPDWMKVHIEQGGNKEDLLIVKQ